jgi:hypothetical protein
MRFTRLYPRRSGLAVAGLAAAMIIAPGIAPASAAGSTRPGAAGQAAAGPTVELEATQPSVTVDSFQGYVTMDPSIWVASLGSALQFDVRRPSYTKPVTITQIIHTPSGPVRARPLPAALLDGWNGLKGFIQMTVRNRSGKAVASRCSRSAQHLRPAAGESAQPDGVAVPAGVRIRSLSEVDGMGHREGLGD